MILITLIDKQYTFIDKLKYQNATFPPNFYYSIFSLHLYQEITNVIIAHCFFSFFLSFW